MERKDFQSLYKNVISIFISEIQEEEKKCGCHCLKIDEKCAKDIYSFYEDKRKELRTRYMKQKPELALDRHKIASCMMYAILSSKIISVDLTVQDIPEQILLSKENLAFHVAVNIVEMYKQQDETEENSDYELIFPATRHEAENGGITSGSSEYVDNILKALYYIKDIRHFDIFAYANILFLLESRTDLLYLKNMA